MEIRIQDFSLVGAPIYRNFKEINQKQAGQRKVISFSA
jgi:hypothetical protein